MSSYYPPIKLPGCRRENKRDKDKWRLEKKKSRREGQHCDMCGGTQLWCSCCECYSATCCADYGTCLCS